MTEKTIKMPNSFGKEIEVTKKEWVTRWQDCTVKSLRGFFLEDEYQPADLGSRTLAQRSVKYRGWHLGHKIMKYTTVKISEIAKHPTKRMDAKYWIKKKLKKEKSCKLQAASGLTACPRDDRIQFALV